MKLEVSHLLFTITLRNACLASTYGTQNIDVHRVGAAYLLTLALMYLACPLQFWNLFPLNEPANHNISVINDLSYSYVTESSLKIQAIFIPPILRKGMCMCRSFIQRLIAEIGFPCLPLKLFSPNTKWVQSEHCEYLQVSALFGRHWFQHPMALVSWQQPLHENHSSLELIDALHSHQKLTPTSHDKSMCINYELRSAFG